eukprot:6623655-Prymnesium_polylepis.1
MKVWNPIYCCEVVTVGRRAVRGGKAEVTELSKWVVLVNGWSFALIEAQEVSFFLARGSMAEADKWSLLVAKTV